MAKDPPPGCRAWVEEESVVLAEIDGAGPYEGGTFKFKLRIPKRYPFDPPETRIETRIYHPNIDSHGRICLSNLKKDNWKPSMNIRTLLISIQSLLSDPNADDPLDADVARLYRVDREAFLKKAREWTIKYASKENVQSEKKTEKSTDKSTVQQTNETVIDL